MVATVIREWIVPGVATAMVAWIVIPTRPAVPDTYAINAVVEHRECALDNAPPPRGESTSYSADDFAALIPDFGGRMHVVKAHGYAHSIDFTHVIVEEDGGRRASIVIARASEGGERFIGPETRDGFEVSQVRTTRHHAVVVIDRDRARALRDWRRVTLERLQRSFRQLEGPSMSRGPHDADFASWGRTS
jgi:hypothetical protein